MPEIEAAAPLKGPDATYARSRWDALLEASVVGSFTSLGHRIRSKGWEPIEERSLEGKTLLMTGATSGIGRTVAQQAVALGARLRFIARNPAKAAALETELGPSGDVGFYLADLSSISEVKEVAQEILAVEPAIDLLINNAVVLPAERQVTAEGLELSHATNLVAPFALTNALIPRIEDSRPARIINMVSGGMYTQGLALDDLNYAAGEYRGSVAYARAKRGLMVLTKIWAEQLDGSGVTVNATHPGWVDTPGVKDSLPTFYRLTRPLLRDMDEGTDTVLWLATASSVATETGKLWHDRAPRSEYRLDKTIESAVDRDRLWAELTAAVDAV